MSEGNMAADGAEALDGIGAEAAERRPVAKMRARVGTGRFEPEPSFEIEGEVVEVLAGCALGSVLSPTGAIYTVDRQTPGIALDELRMGQRVRCQIACKFHRVLKAELVGSPCPLLLTSNDTPRQLDHVPLRFS